MKRKLLLVTSFFIMILISGLTLFLLFIELSSPGIFGETELVNPWVYAFVMTTLIGWVGMYLIAKKRKHVLGSICIFVALLASANSGSLL